MDGETTNLGGSSAALDAIWNVAPDDDVVSNAAPPAPSPAQISRRVAGRWSSRSAQQCIVDLGRIGAGWHTVSVTVEPHAVRVLILRESNEAA